MSRSSRSRPARRFAARTALVLVAIGIATHALVVQTVDAELARQLRFRAQFVTEYLLAPATTGDQISTKALEDLVANPRITSITIRRTDGTEVVSVGTPSADATDVTNDVAVPGSDGLIATITQDDAVVQAAATQLTREVTLVLAAGLGLLWLVIVPLAYRLGRELRGQADELREQSKELRRLLDREHLTVQRLREVDDMRDRFLESISHELRTPITVVQGSLQMLAARGDDLSPEARSDLATRAYEKSKRLSALVQGLLDLNASAESPQHLRWVDLASAIDTARRALPPRDVELDLDVDGIVTDRGQLVRALGALLGNAVRHAPGDDPVVVRARQHGDDVELQVDDRGPGIPPELREAVFEPFRQGHLLDAHSPGTGIGLALVAAYAAQHNGRAWVTERPGGGARIHLLLTDVVGDRADWAGQDVDEDGEDDTHGIVTPVVDSARGRAAPASHSSPGSPHSPGASGTGGTSSTDMADRADEASSTDGADRTDKADGAERIGDDAANGADGDGDGDDAADGADAAAADATSPDAAPSRSAGPTRTVRRTRVVRRTVTRRPRPPTDGD